MGAPPPYPYSFRDHSILELAGVIEEYGIWIRRWTVPVLAMELASRQEVSDDLQSCNPLIIGSHDDPWSEHRMGLREHRISGFGIVLPMLWSLRVNWAQLPLPEGIFPPLLQAP